MPVNHSVELTALMDMSGRVSTNSLIVCMGSARSSQIIILSDNDVTLGCLGNVLGNKKLPGW